MPSPPPTSPPVGQLQSLYDSVAATVGKCAFAQPAPEGASLELEKVADRFEPNTSGTTLRFGAFSFDLGNMVATGGRRTAGYSYREEILPVGRRVYVLGAASDANGALTIVKPMEQGQRFMVSLRTRDQVLQSAQSSARWTLYVAFGAGALSIVLVITGILSRIAG